ncbi:MAG: chemotaxis protein CheW [Clostridia bacterium]|nr:chemotaxis protein CheW [Clostridia bacterium]
MTGKVLTFYLNNDLFGINITLVKEINRNIEYTEIPDAKPHILGLFNMRGQVVTLFNIARLMDLEAMDTRSKNTCIILKASPNDPNQVGFIIDRLGDVVDVDHNDCEVPPANVESADSEYINSVVKLKDELLIIIEPNKLFGNETV